MQIISLDKIYFSQYQIDVVVDRIVGCSRHMHLCTFFIKTTNGNRAFKCS